MSPATSAHQHRTSHVHDVVVVVVAAGGSGSVAVGLGRGGRGGGGDDGVMGWVVDARCAVSGLVFGTYLLPEPTGNSGPPFKKSYLWPFEL
jgi:hypothetical protein